MTLQQVPTLHPTEEQFDNPIGYLASPEIRRLGDRYGFVKVVPPEGFKPPLSINEHRFRFVPRLQNLKELNLINRCRMFFHKQLANFSKTHGLGVPASDHASICGKKVHFYDFFIECVKFYQPQGEGRKLPDISSSRLLHDEKVWLCLTAKFKLQRSLLMDFYEENLLQYFNFLANKPEFSATLIEEQYPTSLLQDTNGAVSEDEEGEDEGDENCLVCGKSSDPENTLLCDSCNKPFHRYCLSPPLSKIPKNSWCCDNCIIGNGYYGFKDSTVEYSLEDFKDLSDDFDKHHFPSGKPQDIDQLEREFWELVNNTDNNVKTNYGADIHKLLQGQVSGFPTKDYIPSRYRSGELRKKYNEYVERPMNLNNLPFNKESLLSYLDIDISGMTIPWIYVGSTFSTFCWHVEDQYTLSANYQHFGATKKWYGIPSHHAEKFESYVKSLAPDLFAKQPDILHQLITLVSPFTLDRAGIDCYTANQQPGEYIITYPRVYHAGFNAGYNFNEAVNFTMTSWLDYGVMASKNYRSSGMKGSVFDLWELMMTVLEKFKDSDDDEDDDDFDLELVQKCLDSMKVKLEDEYAIQATILDSLDIKPQRYNALAAKHSYELTEQEKKEREDGISCIKCKGFCTFAFVRHYEPYTASKSYIPVTPQASPQDTEEGDKRRCSKRIRVKSDAETFKISVYCLEDYLRLQHPNVSRDEFFIAHDLEDAKALVQSAEKKLSSLLS